MDRTAAPPEAADPTACQEDAARTAAPPEEVERLFQLLQAPFLAEARHLAELLASKATPQLLGPTEHQVRDGLHRLGATALQTALHERKKGGTRGPA
jgi:hypothetical protein